MTDEEGGRRQVSGDRKRKAQKTQIHPRNWQEPVILLMLREWNSYGYELMERMAEFGLEAMNLGTLYWTLRHMEQNGAVKDAWETSKSGPARRVYSIIDAGNAYFDLWARSLEQYQRNMDTFFRLYTQGGRPPSLDQQKEDE